MPETEPRSRGRATRFLTHVFCPPPLWERASQESQPTLLGEGSLTPHPNFQFESLSGPLSQGERALRPLSSSRKELCSLRELLCVHQPREMRAARAVEFPEE